MTPMSLGLSIYIKEGTKSKFAKVPVMNLSEINFDQSGWNVLFTKLQKFSHGFDTSKCYVLGSHFNKAKSELFPMNSRYFIHS